MSICDIRPLGNRVVVKRRTSLATKGGILLPDTAKEKPREGEVVAIGPGKWDELGVCRVPLRVQVGDAVLFSNYAGTEVRQDTSEEYLILSEDDILGILV